MSKQGLTIKLGHKQNGQTAAKVKTTENLLPVQLNTAGNAKIKRCELALLQAWCGFRYAARRCRIRRVRQIAQSQPPVDSIFTSDYRFFY